jgi:hypothetical protein
MALYPVQRGAGYFAGLDLPFFLNADDIAKEARARGFSQVIVTPRARARFAFEVRKVPGYRDDWNTAFFGMYDGRETAIEVPAAPAWLFEVRPQIPPPGKAVVAQVVAPVRGGLVPRKPDGSRIVLWVAGCVAVAVFLATLQPVKRHT